MANKLEKEIRRINDSVFEKLLEIDFIPDLNNALNLSSIPEYERTPDQQFLLELLKKKYPLGIKCPTPLLYSQVSGFLRRNYDVIQGRLMEILYPN